MQCPYCLVTVSKSELLSNDIFGEGEKSCPFCGRFIFFQTCTFCSSQYNISDDECPMCLTLDKVNRKEEKMAIACIEDVRTPTMGDTLAAIVNNTLRKGNDPLGRHRSCAFIAKYMLFINKVTTFFNDMEKAIIPNDRNSPFQKIEAVQDFLDFAYAEGSLFEDLIFNPGNVKTDEKLRVEFIHIDTKDLDTPARYYHLLDDDKPVNDAFLGKLFYMHAEAKPLFRRWIENVKDSSQLPAHKWDWLSQETTKLTDRKLFS